jgi:hypothetical protein
MKPIPILLRCAVLACCAALAPSAQAGDDDDDGNRRGVCSATARHLYSACGHEAAEDLETMRAKCLNVADAEQRSQCLIEAREAYVEARKTCGAALRGRRQACTLLGEARYDPPWEPALFDADFRRLSNPNPYFPLGIGWRWQYGDGGSESTVVEVLDAIKLIEGVPCIVVRDLVSEDGLIKEATDDWFAAARDGSTWYCGEESKDYEYFEGDRPQAAELVGNDGSFKHGRELDKAGIIMPAGPRVGMAWREEFSPGEAEDVAQVVSVNYAWGGGSAALDQGVPRELAQRFCGLADCVVTRNWALTEPGKFELKYYARGIGLFVETKPQEGKTLQLVACNFDARCASLPAPAAR